MEAKIKKIELLWQNVKSRRQVKVTLTNGHVIRIDRCHESWEQYGGTTEELWLTMPIAKKYNAWLHGRG